MEEKVLQFLQKYNLADKTIIVGFSGGYDSMCLLHILSKLLKITDIKVIAAHYNHNWRGEEALSEQEHCHDFCKSLNIEFYTECAPVDSKKTETAARELRYSFFDKVISLYKAEAVFTSHNLNDNAETVLYRMIKGTGVEGLKAIQEKRGIFYRPLLSVTRTEIEKYLNDNNLYPNNDSSNNDIKYKRNFIRHKILPLAEQINPKVLFAIDSLSKVASDEIDIVEEYLNKIKADIVENGVISTDKFIQLSKSVKKKFIYKMFVDHDIDYNAERINYIYNFIEDNCGSRSGKKISLSNNIWLYVNNLNIEMIYESKKNNSCISVNQVGDYEFGDYIFKIREYSTNISEFPDDNSFVAYVDLSNLDFNFTLRTRRDGDIINPYGMNGSMKLKKYLISKAVPQHRRNDIMLLCNDKEVLWVAGFGLSNKIYVRGNPTHKIMLESK